MTTNINKPKCVTARPVSRTAQREFEQAQRDAVKLIREHAEPRPGDGPADLANRRKIIAMGGALLSWTGDFMVGHC